jgi:3-deoxy-manno-octulosonate cytidylyltransferase (CMP-KDO synthetase)
LKIIAVIPAHMASVRFPNKILFPFYGLPMIEHVRRRALMCKDLSSVIVATCDDEIASTINHFGGEVVFTSKTHKTGTSRVAEAIEQLDCTHVILLQGDEPLLLPRHIQSMVNAISSNQNGYAWNATGPIELFDELDRSSFVKCVISKTGRIMHCFRRTPSFSALSKQQSFVRKILGIIAYRKDFLRKLTQVEASPIELAEFIEQMRILENNWVLQSVPVTPSLPSVNEPHEADIILEYIDSSEEQSKILTSIIG